ncbi:MAG TPA: hypothetical protein VD978_31470 [Azospirillum sp.]|nr:hypothetical protein [Azospirillum sp.]
MTKRNEVALQGRVYRRPTRRGPPSLGADLAELVPFLAGTPGSRYLVVDAWDCLRARKLIEARPAARLVMLQEDGTVSLSVPPDSMEARPFYMPLKRALGFFTGRFDGAWLHFTHLSPERAAAIQEFVRWFAADSFVLILTIDGTWPPAALPFGDPVHEVRGAGDFGPQSRWSRVWRISK